MNLTITLTIIGLTTLLSFGGFSNHKLIDDLIFYPPAITKRYQWYRFFTCGLIHADLGHLLFNMFSLFMFGDFVERAFTDPMLFGDQGKTYYLVLYISALFVCLIPTFVNHRNDSIKAWGPPELSAPLYSPGSYSTPPPNSDSSSFRQSFPAIFSVRCTCCSRRF